MNLFLPQLSFFLVHVYSATTLQVSSKLDFSQESSLDLNSERNNERLLIVPSSLAVKQQEQEEETSRPLTIVCVTKSRDCDRQRNSGMRKTDVIVQVVTDSEGKSSSGKNFVDVPDVPIVVGNKGVPYYSNVPTYNAQSVSRIPEERTPINHKVYVPLFGSSVLETPGRNHRSAAVGTHYSSTNSYVPFRPQFYGNNNANLRSGSTSNFRESGVKSYFVLTVPVDGYGSNPPPNWNGGRFEGINTENSKETVLCHCQNTSPHFHTITPNLDNRFSDNLPYPQYRRTTTSPFSKRLGIDDKLGPLD